MTSDSIEAKESEYLYCKDSQLPNAGQGLYTAVQLYKEETIAIFRGEILTDRQAASRVSKDEDRYFISMLDGKTLDSMHTDCYAKYANDVKGSSSSNFKNNAKIVQDEKKNICLIATRNILPNEEIFCGYGHRYWKKHSDS